MENKINENIFLITPTPLWKRGAYKYMFPLFEKEGIKEWFNH
jgi:hypothetical protein